MSHHSRSIFTRLVWGAGALSTLLLIGLWWTTHQTVQATLEGGARTQVDIDIAGLVDIYATNGREELAQRIADRVAVIPMEGNTPHYYLSDNSGARLAGDLARWPSLDPRVSESGLIPIGETSQGYARAVQLDDNLRLVVARGMADSEPLLQRIGFVFAIGGAVLVALVLLLGRLAAARLQRRIERINAAFREPTQDALSTLAEPQDGDEIDELTAHSGAALARVRNLMEAYRDTSDQLAHEIRTPLTHLDNRLVKALSEGPKGAVAQKLIEAREEIRRLVQTLESLLDIASSKARKGDKAGLKKFDLSAMVLRICELYAGSAEETGHQFSWQVEGGIHFEGEEWQLSRVLTNLLDNAFKYVPQGGHVEVALSADATGPVLTVSDDGPGVPKDERSRIFERFFRGGAEGASDQTDQVPGSGLGLALAHAIAERHGLALTIEDTPSGATFRLARP
ncbi:MAG: HAMP domain-containing sensor histidine kinase [Pseudomonadota bacterium]